MIEIDWDQYETPRSERERKRIRGILEYNPFLDVCEECGAVCDASLDLPSYPATKSGFVDNHPVCEDTYDSRISEGTYCEECWRVWKAAVESMEKEMGMSHTNFYRKIKNLTGQSGKELLQNMRLKRATQLISQQKLRISEIAYMTGFTNPKYFSKCFRDKFGLSPTEYLSAYKPETPADS